MEQFTLKAMSEFVLSEFTFVQELPLREKSRLQKLWDHFAEVRKIVTEHGMLVPIALAAELAGVARQRIDELVEHGQLHRVELNGKPFVTENSFVAWAKSERKDGRPLGVETISNKEMWAVASKVARQSRKNTSK